MHATNLLTLITGAMNQFATHEETIRTIMKNLRHNEEQLDEKKKRRRGVGIKAESADKKLSRMSEEVCYLFSYFMAVYL